MSIACTPAAANPDLDWITGGGWMIGAFPGGTPTKEDLDAAVPDRPVFLMNTDGSGLQQITNYGGFTSFPEFSPDGKKLVFASDKDAKNMIDLKWAPLVGATLITQKAWNTVPAELRDVLLRDARAASLEQREAIRKQGEDAVSTMQKVNRLNVIHADAAVMAEWRREVENVYPRIRGKIVPADLFDEVKRLRDEYRGQHEKGAQ